MELSYALVKEFLSVRVLRGDRKFNVRHAVHEIGLLPRPLVEGLAMA
jgi:hypothetical protein